MAEPSVGLSAAISAYSKTSQGADVPGLRPRGGEDGEFANLVRTALEEARRVGGQAEEATMAGMTGKADVSQVVTAVAEAEIALQTLVSVRDKVIEAYKDIVKMPM